MARLGSLALLLCLAWAPGAAPADGPVTLPVGKAGHGATERLANPAEDVTATKAALEGAGLDPSPFLPEATTGIDRKKLIDFEATRKGAVEGALAGGTGADVAALRDILAGEPLAIAGDGDLLGKWRCRSAQLDAGTTEGGNGTGGVFVYPHFRCTISRRAGGLFFAKLNGSQRVNGMLYRAGKDRFAFLGGWSMAEDPERPYGASQEDNAVAYLFKVAKNRLRLELPQTCCSTLEILELVR